MDSGEAAASYNALIEQFSDIDKERVEDEPSFLGHLAIDEQIKVALSLSPWGMKCIDRDLAYRVTTSDRGARFKIPVVRIGFSFLENGKLGSFSQVQSYYSKLYLLEGPEGHYFFRNQGASIGEAPEGNFRYTYASTERPVPVCED